MISGKKFVGHYLTIRNPFYKDLFIFFLHKYKNGSFRDVVANVLACDPVVNEFDLQSSYLPNPSARAGYDTRSIF